MRNHYTREIWEVGAISIGSASMIFTITFQVERQNSYGILGLRIFTILALTIPCKRRIARRLDWLTAARKILIFIIRELCNMIEMYEQIVIVTFIVGLQVTLSWRYHTIYMKLHREFKKAVDGIVGERKNLFRTELLSLAKELADAEKDREHRGKSRTRDPEYDKKEEMLFNLVANINEPMNIYLKTRNAVRRLSEYLFFSAILALFGLLPAALNMIELVFFYFLFLLPLSVAILAWSDFNVLEEKLVNIRDQEK